MLTATAFFLQYNIFALLIENSFVVVCNFLCQFFQ